VQDRLNKWILERSELTHQLSSAEEKTRELQHEEIALQKEIADTKARVGLLEGRIGESFSLTSQKMAEHFELQKKEPELRCELKQVRLYVFHVSHISITLFQY
jgi:predicted  nucleic acid-binding Zn-ribbon protein